MAQKRMFDRAIIDTDRFMDLSMSAKALYFLLGMEADDEGFVSYKKVMRIHGGNEDDIKILVVKEFLIAFDSGVMVITDWNTNNWLDTRRIKPTEYQKEKSMLHLTDKRKYLLSKGLASAQLEERRGEENSTEESIVAPLSEIEAISPKQKTIDFFKGVSDLVEYQKATSDEDKARHQTNEMTAVRDFLRELAQRYPDANKNIVWAEILKFCNHWTELNSTGKKKRWQMEKTFEVDRRLAKWFSNKKEFDRKLDKPKGNNYSPSKIY